MADCERSLLDENMEILQSCGSQKALTKAKKPNDVDFVLTSGAFHHAAPSNILPRPSLLGHAEKEKLDAALVKDMTPSTPIDAK